MQRTKSLHAINRLLPTTPASGLPGYLRTFAAEAFSVRQPEVAPTGSNPTELPDEAASKAHAHLVSTLMQAVVNRAAGSPHMPVHDGLQQLKEQQLAAGVTLATSSLPHVSRALAAITYHQRMMDGTPKGRKLQEDWQRQIILETRAVEAATAKYKREMDSAIARGAGATLPAARKMLLQWFPTLTEAIYEEQVNIAQGASGMDRNVYGPYLIRLEPDQLAVITMHCALNAFMSPEGSGDALGAAPGTTRLTKVAMSIGKAVEAQYMVKQLQEEVHKRNTRRKEVRDLYGKGLVLQERLEEKGVLTEEEWKQWFKLGDELRSEGEQLPLDYTHWFRDTTVTQRLKEMTAPLRAPDPNTYNHKTTKNLQDRTKRLIQEPSLTEWSSDVLAKVGVILVKKLIESAFIDTKVDGELVTAPAFWHNIEQGPDVRSRGSWKKYGLIFAHEAVIGRIKPHQMVEAFMPQFLPMVIPPVPWQRHNLGGHLTLRSNVMRVRGTRSQRERLEQADQEMVDGRGMGLSQVYDALNALGSTPWSINPSVYQVVEAIWAWGGGICDVPSRTNLNVPEELKGGFRLHHTKNGQLQLFAHHRDVVKRRALDISRAKKKNNELHSLRCDMEYKLAIAREFLKEPRFYFPHNVDFRGRAYPMHPHLNHLGSDLCRGVLQFADPRPLGPNGLKWLYIQAANLWGHGVDKLPLAGRVKWAEDNLGIILDNAADPFRQPVQGEEGSTLRNDDESALDSHIAALETLNKADTCGMGHAVLRGLLSQDASADKLTPFWFRAEAPFQFLATCFEIHGALASADPPSYKSRLPVHQDGSCNGLQHYAALGRDLTGGWAVNLCPTDRPQDVYTEISKLVQRRVAADAQAGVPEAQLLQSSTEVDRKLVKQTVMTSVYGVTFVGARAQIGNRLKERGFEDNTAMYRVSCYAARVTLDCLHEMFQSAKHIMQWLSECARLIAKEGHSMTWTTPLGLPVVQPYRRKSRQHVRTVLQRLVLVENHDDLPVMKQRQRTAFPPNYIHSIDSSHMMLTAIACKEAGLDFAGVHDSFWTHAGTVDQMNVILRDQFIELHSQPLLEELLEEMQRHNPEVNFPPLPPKGDLNLEDIRGATYFFS